MLRDSRSYETQLIEAVRSVNRALGGSYGTSSAIGRTEFNQFEVQLIDAIKGIGRTLTGKGLSVGGGSGADLVNNDAFLALSKRVSKLESESFFRLVDGNVTLKTEYQNLWVPGWLAAGGIGNGSGGGGGVTKLRELEDVYHTEGSGVLHADGTPANPGDSLVYNAILGWLAAPAGSGSGTVTGVKMNGVTLSPSSAGIVDLGTVITSLSGYATESWVQQQGYLTSFTETDPTVPAWAKAQNPLLYVGTTRVQTTETPQNLTGILSVQATTDLLSKFVWDDDYDAWRFLGNLYADGWVAAGGIGSGGSGGGTDLAAVWASLTNSVVDPYASTKINIAHIPTLTASDISDLETWISGKGYISTETDPTVPAWAKNQTPQLFIGTTQVQMTQVAQHLTGILSINATSDPTSASMIVWEPNAGGEGVGAWHFIGNLYADGWVAAGGIGSAGGGGGYVLPIASDTVLGGIKVGNGLAIDQDGVLSVSGVGVSYLRLLEDVYHNVNGVLRADGTTPAQPGDSLVYDSTHGWLAAPGGSVTVVDNLTSTSTTNALSANQGRTLKSIIDAGYVFKGFLHPQDDGTAVCDYPVCYISGISGAYYGYGPLNVNLSDGELALIYRAKNSSTWNYKTTTISGGGGGGGSYSAGTGISISNGVISLKTASTSQLGGVKVDGTTITISNGVISSTGGGGGGGGSTVVVTPILTSGTPIATISVDGSSTTLYAPSGGGGGSSVSWGTSGSDYQYLSVDGTSKKLLTEHQSLAGYVTLHTTQTIDGAKTFEDYDVTLASSSGLSVHQSSHIDIGPIRIKFENNALHITKKDSSDTNNYGIYADGFVAAGGIQ